MRHLQSFLGLLNWHAWLRGLACPFTVGAWCWLSWVHMLDGEHPSSQSVPLRVLHGLALAAKPWRAPSGAQWLQLSLFCFGAGLRLQTPDVSVGDFIVCVDGAEYSGVWWVGVLAPFLGVQVFQPPFRWFASQQTTKLQPIVWAIRLAVR